MKSTKSKKHNQTETRQLRVVVAADVELIYADGKEALFNFPALDHKGEHFEVYLDGERFEKQQELFLAGHRLVLVAEADKVSPILFLTDAWFDRDCA